MRRLRKYPLPLVIIAFCIPFAVAILYFNFYDESDFISYKRFVKADECDLLSFLRKNPRIVIAAENLSLSSGEVLGMIRFFHYLTPAIPSQKNLVLRC